MIPGASIGLDVDQTRGAGLDVLTELELGFVGRNRLRIEKCPKESLKIELQMLDHRGPTSTLLRPVALSDYFPQVSLK